MSDATFARVVDSICTGLPAALLALATLIQSVKNGKKADLAVTKTAEVHAEITGKAEEIKQEIRNK